MRPCITTAAPAHLRQRFQAALERDGWPSAMRVAAAAGYDTPRPPTPATDELAVFTVGTVEHAVARTRLSDRIRQEQRAVAQWDGRRRWASEPSETEQTAARAAARADAERQAAVERRTAELLAEQTARAEGKARAQAEREVVR